MRRGGRCHCLLRLLLLLLLLLVLLLGMMLLLRLLLLVAELVLLLLEATEGMIHETTAPATSDPSTTCGRRRRSPLDDLHRQTVRGAEGLCWRVTGRGRTRKRSHPLDHVRKVHPLGM